MRVLESSSREGREFLLRQTRRGDKGFLRVQPTIKRILEDVRSRGLAAVEQYARELDKLPAGTNVRVSTQEMSSALAGISRDFREAAARAIQNIRNFCEWQKPQEWFRTVSPGVSAGQIVRPLASVGCYVPGGRYPLPSTLCMTVIPAQVAGVKRIVVTSPDPATETLAVAAMLGINEFYRIGGAQAIAALAYGATPIAPVAKIVGPGNAFVTAAKKMVSDSGVCAIDMLAGPTEALIVSESGNETFIAADLVAQAEHDPDATCIFVSASRDLAHRVSKETTRLAAGNAIAQQSLRDHGACIVATSHDEALEIANGIGSEHLTIAREDLPRAISAGSIFLGEYSSQPLGDYATGPNHVLPTGGSARVRGGLSVSDFVKIITVQEVSAQGLQELAPVVMILAKAEGLSAHAEAVRLRTERLSNQEARCAQS
jgi:histidinol dehydrogenase